MVDFSNAQLDRAFAALADPTQRAIVDRLARETELAVTEIAGPFAVSLPAVMKHLDVLSDAGLITRAKTGRTVACRLTAEPMEEAMRWLNHYQRFWSEQLDRLAAFLEDESCQPTSNRASPSSAASTRRRRKSSAPGRTRKS